MVNATVRHVRLRAILAALFALGGGFAIALLALLTAGEPLVSYEVAFLVNGFKFLVGVSALFAAAYFEFGPELYERGIATRWLPPADVPLAAILSLLIVGVASLLASTTVFSRDIGAVLFGRVLAFALLGAAVAAGSVYLYAYAVAADHADDDSETQS